MSARFTGGMLLVAVACGPGASPPAPAPVPAAARSARKAPASAAAPPAPSAASPPERPACLPLELRHAGRVVAAERTPGGGLAYCIRKGFALDAVTRCLTADPRDGSVGAHEELWPGFRLGDTQASGNPGSAMYASAAGTLTVCAGKGDCWERRFRPAAKDAWDEVYGAVPAFTVPGTRRVLVADVTEGAGPATLWIHAYDVGKRVRSAATRVVAGEYGIALSAFGSRVLLVSCAREGHFCHAFVIEPKALQVQPLGVELDPALRGGMSDPAPASLQLDDGSWVVVDARGERVLVHDVAGKLLRRVTLSRPGDLGLGPSRAIPMGAGQLAVIQGAPNAGIVEWISLGDGSLTTLVPPECPDAQPAR